MSRKEAVVATSGAVVKPPVLGRAEDCDEKTVFMIWMRAGGRCQFRGCNRDLLEHLPSATPHKRLGYVAHIVAASPAGPRGDQVRSQLLSKDIRNVMLLCDGCHRTIDSAEHQANYSEALLLEMKRDHEARIKLLTGLGEDRASHVLCYGADIGKQEANLSMDRIGRAMTPERFPASMDPIKIELQGLASRDNDPCFWTTQQQNLRSLFDQRVKPRLERRELPHLSVFAIAPQPLLMELGRLLGDIGEHEVRQLHREPAGWRWAEDGPPIEFVIRRPTSFNGAPALILGVSAPISDERITSVLGEDVSIWSIMAAERGVDVMRRKEDLSRFRKEVRAILAEIKAAHGENAIISVFPALPVSAAVEVGRVWMQKADLPLQVYDQQPHPRGFLPALMIQGGP